MTTFNFRGLPDCFVRMIRFFVIYIYAAIYKTPHMVARMVALFLTRDSPGSDPDDPEPH